MNYDCMTPISSFITIATKFLSKHCIKRELDSEMNGYHCFDSILQRDFLTSRSVDPKQPSHFHFVPSLKLSQGEVHDLSGGAKRSQGRCALLHTSPQNPALMQINHHS